MSEGIDDNYVAYLRYDNRRDNPDVSVLRLCDSDSPGAFKVFRAPALLKMYVWRRGGSFFAVACANSVASARQSLLEGAVGESGDGSTPERDKARAYILSNMPDIWYGPNSEFTLTDNANLIEADAECDKLRKNVAALQQENDRLKNLERIWIEGFEKPQGGPTDFTPQGILYTVRTFKAYYENELAISRKLQAELDKARARERELVEAWTRLNLHIYAQNLEGESDFERDAIAFHKLISREGGQ